MAQDEVQHPLVNGDRPITSRSDDKFGCALFADAISEQIFSFQKGGKGFAVPSKLVAGEGFEPPTKGL